MEGGFSHFFEVKLDLFDGPIDLLLHLVKLNELSIEQLSLAQIADQYLACLEDLQQMDLEIAGEYLVIAATLVSIKSKYLLTGPVEFEMEEEGGIGPHEELLIRLREAAIFKDSAERLDSLSVLGRDVFAPPPSLKGSGPAPVRFKNQDPFLLGKAFRSLLEKTGSTCYEVSLESVSILDRMMKVIDQLKSSGGSLEFSRLIPDLRSRLEIVATFIALLELCKRQVISVRQDEVFEQIFIDLSGGSLELGGVTSEFDLPAGDEKATANV